MRSMYLKSKIAQRTLSDLGREDHRLLRLF
jgi:hypothetical protein